MSKRKRRKSPGFSPATMLRPRLDTLWTDEVLLRKGDEAIINDLNALARGVATDSLVLTVLRAYLAASAPVRARLDTILPRWLSERGHADTLQEMVAGQSLGPGLRPPALAWLKTMGADTKTLEHQPSLFLKAYYHDDEALWGEKSQAQVTVFWYTDPGKKRAQGIGFLLDYNPPWDGSVKDVLVSPRRPPKRLLEDVLSVWRRGDMDLESISAERAKVIILTALNCNRAANIRLPRDLIAARDVFDRYVLSLPDAPDTPSFTMDDFDLLARNGKPPEEIVHFERTVGRRVRLEDGSELVVMGSPGLDDEEW